MIKKIIEFSAHNRFIVLTTAAVLTLIGWWCLQNVTLDAIPDLSDTQVIVYSRWDRSPDVIEDQVTYPIITALLGAPRVKAIRGFSDFGFSYIYIIFEDGTDPYWARTRTLEYLSKITPRLPEGVRTELGPDATGVGWVFQYALVDRAGRHGTAKLRSFHDFHWKYALQSVPGVAEIATLGGFVRQYQVQIDPEKLIAYGIPIDMVVEKIRASNNDVGGRLIEKNGREYMVRGRGYIKSISDIENIAVMTDLKTGTPVLVKHLGLVQIGPDIRRGISDLNGEGDVVGGIVVMRYGENALKVIDRVKARIEELKPTLPEGVEIVTTYDRSELIRGAVHTLKSTLIDEIIIVSLVILLFLWHIPSAIVPIVTIPVSIIISFIPFYFMGFSANIMSLSGIAISIGVLVDGAIVEVENAYKKLEHWVHDGKKGDFHAVRLEALKEVGPSVFFSLLVIAVAFLPVFTLVDQEGRLFKPLAMSKNLTMALAAILAITLDPALRMLFTRMDEIRLKPRWLSRVANAVLVGTYYREERHPISRRLFRIYEPVCRFVLRHRWQTIGGALLLVLLTLPAYFALGSEFMPPLNEGAILYMPTTVPGLSVSEAERILQAQDRVLKSFPEVETVYGKIGRAETSTDPAPFSMVETTVILKPESEWRKKERWFSPLPDFLHGIFSPIWRDRITYDELVSEMDEKMRFPGWTNAWTMPIKNRIDMLSTGIKTPVGIKIFGGDLTKIEEIGRHLEMVLQNVPGTRSVFAERVAGGFFLDFVLRREDLARYGLTVDQANMLVMTAVGGETVTTTIEGRERYSVNVRYKRERRDDIADLERVLVTLPNGATVPISTIADVRYAEGPAMIRDENGRLAGYVFVDIADRDVGSYLAEAQRVVRDQLPLMMASAPPKQELTKRDGDLDGVPDASDNCPQVANPEQTPSENLPGVGAKCAVSWEWSGQYENMRSVRERLKIVLPVTLFLIFFLLYFNTKSVVKTGIVMLAVPFSLIGAVWLLWFLDYNLSIAVWVGMIALMGLDAETGVFMLLYLDLAYDEAKREGRMNNESDLDEAIVHGAVKRIRPKMMTVVTAFMGLLPIMWSFGVGADMMKRIAAPMVGGLATSFALELIVYPAIYAVWKGREMLGSAAHGAGKQV